jgi:phosphate transport system permease protein
MSVTPDAAPGAAHPGSAASHARWQELGDRVFKVVCLLAALSVPALTVLMVVFLTAQSLPSISRFGLRFLVDTDWDKPGRHLGALPFIYGTLVTSAVAMALAVPLGVGAAAFLSEIASGTVRRLSSFLIELLAAIPSVVYGFWGLFFLVPIFQRVLPWFGSTNTSGKGYFTAGVLLAIMIVPYVTAVTFDVCRAVPTAQRQGALALGATRWQLIWSVVLPYARGGIIGAGFLALGRAVGETMAVAMLVGNSPQISLSLFARGYTIPAVIANELPTPENNLHISALVELGLVLFLVTVVVNTLARLMIWRMESQGRPLRLPWWPRTRRAEAPALPAPSANGPAGRSPPPRTTPLVSATRNPWAEPMNRVMTAVLGACLVVILIPLFHILGYILWEGVGSLNLAFFTNLPVDDPPGLGNALLGSVIMVGLATLGAVPVGILAALYLTEYRASRVTPVVRFVGELLGGVPSVVLGVFAYALLVVPLGKFSAWAGSFALAVMMIPIVMRASEESLKLVPSALRNASYALGASHWQTVVRVIVPASLPAIITGVFLAIARIAGETAPLLFTAYSSLLWPESLNDRTPFLTYYIYNGATGDDPTLQRLAWAAAVVLLVFVMALNIGIRLLTGQRVVQASRAD